MIIITAQSLKDMPLTFNLRLCAYPKPTKDRQGRAPAFERMLQEETSHQPWEEEPFAAGEQTQRNTCHRNRRGISFQAALNIPFVVQLRKAGIYVLRVLGIVRDAALQLPLDAFIDVRCGVPGYALGGVG